MKHFKKLLLPVSIIISTASAGLISWTWDKEIKNEITIVDRPDTTAQNSFYLNNKKPLVQNSFIKLPVTAIKPYGWLKEYLVRQKNGLTGRLGEISVWLQKEDNAWLAKDGKGQYGWEEVPYWLKGYANIGYILNDEKIIKESKVWIEGVLNSQREDGNFGPTNVDKNGAEDFWPKMIMLYCLQSYYEYSNDKRVISFMQDFFKYQLDYPQEKFIKQYHYWQGLRTGDNLHSVLWLYNITGDNYLLDLAKKIHNNSTRWDNRNTIRTRDYFGIKPLPDWFKLLPDWHNVNIAQGFREPATFYQLSNDTKDLQASYDVFNIVRQYFGQVPGGLFGSDENARPGYTDPRQATETCGMVEQMNSDEHLLRITGDISWADNAENVAFNSYPSAVMPDFKSLRYLTSPNMIINDSKNHSPAVANEGPFMMMNPFSSRCCQHNHSQGWPYFSENLWMATPDNGVAAVLYAASEVMMKAGDGTEIKFEEISNYPFDDKLTFKFHSAKTVSFPMYLRIPAWCSNAAVMVNGKKINVQPAASKYVKINRSWKEGDVVILTLPMKVNTTAWKENKNSVSVNYGPLTFSLKIKEDYSSKESDKTAQWDSKWQKGADLTAWPSYEIHALSPWNYGLQLNEKNTSASFSIEKKSWPKNNFPFTVDDVPIILKAKARQIPGWKTDESGLCGVLMQSPVKSNEPLQTIELIPMGAARLRISAFPIIDK
jgi:Beta-L-arabinofuranosidase, GH127